VDVIASRAWVLSKRILRTIRTLRDDTTAGELHTLRIDAKKLRYLIDGSVHFANAADVQRVLCELKKLQRELGDFNDACVQEARFLEYARALGDASGPPETLIALGRLAEHSRQRHQLLRGQLAEKLTRFRAEARSACRRAFKQAWADGYRT
jgi:CHAD domain-containing protein